MQSKSVTTGRASLLASVLLLLGGCTDPADQFTAGRLLDPCDGWWPVCTTVAGCVVNNTLYLEGKLPGTRRMIVRTQRHASIAVSVYLNSEGAIGHEARIDWGDACGIVASESLTGADLFKEFEATGVFSRTKNVAQGGDHLVTFSSDATADYLLKVDVIEIGG